MIRKHKIKAVTPRLSDEDPDPIEQDDAPDGYHLLQEGWLPWDADDIIDIRRLINTRMPQSQRLVLEAFLDGYTYYDIEVSEKYWRYHFFKGVEFIKKELKL
jgi:hypothetical protein